jgi:hypothetical protein
MTDWTPPDHPVWRKRPPTTTELIRRLSGNLAAVLDGSEPEPLEDSKPRRRKTSKPRPPVDLDAITDKRIPYAERVSRDPYVAFGVRLYDPLD